MTAQLSSTQTNWRRVWPLLVPYGALLATSVTLFSVLLLHSPFDGLSGQDSYAYLYQSRELWARLWGLPVPQWPFVGEGLYHWPVGYHLHIMLGFLFAGQNEVGGRIITLIMAALTPLLVAVLTGLVWRGASALERSVAGVIAGVVLLVTGIYNRTGISLMADVPALFWATLAICCLLKAWPPIRSEEAQPRVQIRWAIACGAALGLSVLLRYASFLYFAPIILDLFFVFRSRARYRHNEVAVSQRANYTSLAFLFAAFLVTLSPQFVYLLLTDAHQAGSALSSVVWDPLNFLRKTLTGPDGTATFTHTMARFYFLDPLYDASVGFLSPLYLPALLAGLFVLFQQRNSALFALLAGWALIPPAFLSGGLYQAHRFVLMYIPPLCVLIGIGAARLLRAIIEGRERGGDKRQITVAALAAALCVALIVGSIESVRVSGRLVSDLANSKNQELAVIAAAKNAEGGAGDGAPKAVVFGLSAAIYHYTGWPVLDIYNHDSGEIAAFLSGSGPRLAIVPEASMTTQWAGTPSGDRWQWLRAHYNLSRIGGSSIYNVYTVATP